MTHANKTAAAVTVMAAAVFAAATAVTHHVTSCVLVAVAALIAVAGLAVRRRRAGPWSAASVRTDGFRVSPLTGGFLLLSAALAGGAVWLAVASANWQCSPGFAQRWLVPPPGSHPTPGVRDDYPGRRAFRLTLRTATMTVNTWELTMTYGESRQRTVTAPGGGKLAATLTAPDRVLSVTS